jgi:hypothetical protein
LDHLFVKLTFLAEYAIIEFGLDLTISPDRIQPY